MRKKNKDSTMTETEEPRDDHLMMIQHVMMALVTALAVSFSYILAL
jgi:hypothetical protein